MKPPAARPAAPGEDVAGPCRIGEHEACHGNVNLPSGLTHIPVPLLRCACYCHGR
ncbi:hypothetical protein [Streptomyces mirabilis]|uniref:hypothetical protein n=1 Tax=Streptomyces mirabilis TaxID=68239 RepID=UPI00369AD158